MRNGPTGLSQRNAHLILVLKVPQSFIEIQPLNAEKVPGNEILEDGTDGPTTP